MRHFILMLLLLLPVVCAAQNDTIPEQKEQLSTGKVPFARSLSIYADIGKPAMMWLETESKLEGGIQFTMGSGILIEGAYGTATLEPQQVLENGDYKSNGSYMRFSTGYQWVVKEVNRLQITAGYGMSSFDDSGVITITSEIFDDYVDEFSRTELTASWAEIAVLTEAEIAPRLYAGLTLRLRYLIESDNFDDVPVLSVPGYGYRFNVTTPALNIHLRFRIPE